VSEFWVFCVLGQEFGQRLYQVFISYFNDFQNLGQMFGHEFGHCPKSSDRGISRTSVVRTFVRTIFRNLSEAFISLSEIRRPVPRIGDPRYRGLVIRRMAKAKVAKLKAARDEAIAERAALRDVFNAPNAAIAERAKAPKNVRVIPLDVARTLAEAGAAVVALAVSAEH
jgi:hypothetical protein